VAAQVASGNRAAICWRCSSGCRSLCFRGRCDRPTAARVRRSEHACGRRGRSRSRAGVGRRPRRTPGGLGGSTAILGCRDHQRRRRRTDPFFPGRCRRAGCLPRLRTAGSRCSARRDPAFGALVSTRSRGIEADDIIRRASAYCPSLAALWFPFALVDGPRRGRVRGNGAWPSGRACACRTGVGAATRSASCSRWSTRARCGGSAVLPRGQWRLHSRPGVALSALYPFSGSWVGTRTALCRRSRVASIPRVDQENYGDRRLALWNAIATGGDTWRSPSGGVHPLGMCRGTSRCALPRQSKRRAPLRTDRHLYAS
jgi:hypothetical protein